MHIAAHGTSVSSDVDRASHQEAHDPKPQINQGLGTWLVLSFVSGAAVMNGEIAAGRLLAPYLGTNTSTWAMLIGTVLGSLTIGNLLGGAISKRGTAPLWVVRLLALSSLLLSAVPRVLPAAFDAQLDHLRLGNLASLAFGAAIAAIAIAAPMVTLGALSPLLLHSAASVLGRSPTELGSIAGRVNAAGTVGSLVGTFAAGIVLLPWLGTRATFDVAAVALAISAILFGLHAGIRRETRLAMVVAIIALGLAMLPQRSSVLRRGHLVEAFETRFQHVAIVEKNDEIQIRVNEGFAVQSFVRKDKALPIRDVWSYYAIAPSFGQIPSPRRVLLLGLGGGTAAEIYRRLYPEARVVGVELDAGLVDAGRRHFGLDLANVDVVIEDARTFVEAEWRRASGTYDVIILDAFQFPYIPFQLATSEFFAHTRQCLAPGGVLMVNAGRYREERGVVFALARTLSSVFPHIQAADAPTPSNTLLVAADHAPSTAVGIDGLVVSAETRGVLRQIAAQNKAMQQATWPANTPLLTDDHAPVEWLTDRIVWRAL